MSADGANDTESMDLWRVRLPNGDERFVTLEKLDDLFQAGHIDERTLVLAEGESEWRTLGEVAGLDAPYVPPPPTSMSMSIPLSTPSMRALPSAPPPPVVADVDFDMPELRSSKKKLVVMGLAAAMLIGVAALGLTKLGGGANVNVDAQTAAAAAAALTSNASTQVAPPPRVDPPPAPAPEVKPQLSDDQRTALLSADKARDARTAKIKATKAAKAPGRRAPKGANPFHKGGAKFDPLNSAL